MQIKPRTITTTLAAIGVFLLCAISVWSLRAPYSDYVWNRSFEGFSSILPTTTWAALKVWTFWGLATALSGLILLRIDPELGLCDAIVGGAICPWIFAYIAGNLLGPVGLFRSYTIWLVMVAGIVWLWRHPPAVTFRAPTTGQMLALLACALVTIGTLPLQLGSPLPPYMDVLNTPASAQRILTFGRYLPFDNDPYGYWSPFIQTPGVELFYAMLGFGSFTKLAVVAEMSAVTPMCWLIIFGAYRLGRSLMNDVAGGFAALLLFATTIFVRAHSMRGTAVAFALVAIGLAFLLDQNRRPIKLALGALALGTAIASHAIVGALALATGGTALLIGLPGVRAKDFLVEAGCLFGAVLVAVPELAVAMTISLPYPILPMSQLAGVFVIWLAASSLQPTFTHSNRFSVWIARGLVVAMLLLLIWHPSSMARLHYLAEGFPMLFAACILGLTALGLSDLKWPVGVFAIAGALMIGAAAEYAVPFGALLHHGSEAGFGFDDVVFKLAEYWYPYFLIFPAAAALAVVYRNVSKVLSIALLLTLLIYPFFQHPELDIMYTEHSLAQEWANDWLIAKQGWWGNTKDTRWAQSPAELELNKVFLEEIREGRITTETHIVHITPNTIMWQDILLFSMYTGVEDDLYLMSPDPQLGQGPTAGSRLYPVSMLPDAIAKRPPYIVVHNDSPAGLTLPPSGYDEIFNKDNVRLFRRDDLSPGATASSSRR
jgi:hypothetical protein